MYILFKSIWKFVLFRTALCIYGPFYFKLYYLLIEKSLFCIKFNAEKKTSQIRRVILQKKKEENIKKYIEFSSSENVSLWFFNLERKLIL